MWKSQKSSAQISHAPFIPFPYNFLQFNKRGPSNIFFLVKSFGEVSEKKIGGMYENQLSNQSPKPKVPIVHYSELQAPFLVAVKERRWFLFIFFHLKN